MKSVALPIFVAAASIALTQPARSQESGPWGCEVLLCAVSSNPNWQNVPYCIPPMVKLIQRLSWGGSWPGCPNSNSQLGYDPYRPCRDDYYPVMRWETYGSDDGQRRQVHMCQSREPVRICYMDHSNQRDGELRRPREVCYNDYRRYHRVPNPNPYHYDIRNEAGIIERHSFNLDW